MKLPGYLLAAVLAGIGVYAAATTAPTVPAPEVWPVTVHEQQGLVVLAREDFDAIVTIYNRQRETIRRLLAQKGCR